MRNGLILSAVVVLNLVGCAGGLSPTFGVAPQAKIENNQDQSTILKASDIAAVYNIDKIIFDSDTEKNCVKDVLLDHSLQTVSPTVNCVKNDMQARLDQAYLIIGSAGNFSFYYSIVNDKGSPVQVGPFESGSMSGTVTMGVDAKGNDTIGFVAGGNVGLADDQETDYILTKSDTGYKLTNSVIETPSAHFKSVDISVSK